MDPNEALAQLRAKIRTVHDTENACAEQDAQLERENSNDREIAELRSMRDDLDRELSEIAELFDGLDNWLTAGGFMPAGWQRSRLASPPAELSA